MTAYQVQLSRSAAREFKRLGEAERDGVRRALGGKSVKTIRGMEDSFHRLRVGDHRVLYDVLQEDRVILVLGIVARADLERWLRSR